MRVDKQIEAKYKKELFDLIQRGAQNRELLDVFLSDLLTPAELTDLAARVQIVKRLKANQAYRKIMRDLHVGLTTVNRGANVLENLSGGFNRILK